MKDLALRAVKDRFAESSNQEAEMEGAKEAVKIMQAKIERSKDRIDSAGKLRSKGFGFVEFQEHAHALAALRQLNNNPTYFGAAKRLMVEFALENVLVLRKRDERMKRIQEVCLLLLTFKHFLASFTDLCFCVGNRRNKEHRKKRPARRPKRGRLVVRGERTG